MAIFQNQKSRIALLLSLAGVLILLNNLPIFYRYGGSETVSVIRYLKGQLPADPDLYLNRVLEYKSRIPFIRLSYHVTGFLGLEAHRMDHVYAFLSAYAVFLAVFLLLRKLKAGPMAAFAGALWFITMNPLRGVVYGYHYKVGMTGANIGMISFSVVTVLFYLYYSNKAALHALFLVTLFFIHPLNAFLYIGFVAARSIVRLIADGPEGKREFLRVALPTGALGLAFLAVSAAQFNSSLQANDPERLMNLLLLVNSEGRTGGYFFSWMNPDKLKFALIFFPSLLLFFVVAARKGLQEDRFLRFCLAFTLYALFLCALNYAFYLLRSPSMLALDLSRVFALQIPLAFTAILAVIHARYQAGNGRNIALLAVLLLAGAKYAFFFLPLAVLLLLYGNEKRVPAYIGVFFALLAGSYFIRLEGGSPALSFSVDLSKNRLPLLLMAFCVFVAAFYPWLKRGQRIGVAAVLLVALFAGYRHSVEYRELLREYGERDLNYGELENFIRQNAAKDDIFLATDTTFGYNGLALNLINWNYTAYGIYMGNLGQLEKEARLLWDIELSDRFRERFLDSPYVLEGSLEGYMHDFLNGYDARRVRAISAVFPRFKYIVLERDQELTNAASLPIRQVFSNDWFRVYRLTDG